MTTIVFWVAMPIIAAFIFEFGRKLDVTKYPDVAAGLLVVLLSCGEIIIGVAKGRIVLPDSVVFLLVGFSTMAGHFVWAQFKAWKWPTPFVDRRKPTNTNLYKDDGDLTRTFRSLERKRA